MRKMKFIRVIVSILFCSFIAVQGGFGQEYEGRILGIKKTIGELTSGGLKNRKMGSEGEKAAAEFLYEKLNESGVIMLTPKSGEDFLYIQPNGDTISSANIIGVVEGYDSLLRNEFVVVGAHYDNLGSEILKREGIEIVQDYLGADANASGVAVLLDVAKQVVQEGFMLKRSVIFALFGGGEIGSSGSWYFLNRSFKNVDKIVAMVNLDMVGRNNGEEMLYYYSGDGNVKISKLIQEVSQMPLSLTPKHSPIDFKQSDHRNFYAKGIPIIFFTSGMHKDYRTVRDTPDKLDFNFMARVADFATGTTLTLANNDVNVGKKEETKLSGESDNVYSQAEVSKMATFFKGGEKQFLEKWVYHYVKYPDSAMNEGIEGVVTADFIVEKNGEVSNVSIRKGVCEEIDNEVVRVISASPKWKAAEKGGTPVRVKISVPVEFKLTKKGKFKLKK